MKKPKFRSYWFRTRSLFYWFPVIYYCGSVQWEDNNGTPRIIETPYWELHWGYWYFRLSGGKISEWEWYIWVNKYCGGDEGDAMKRYPKQKQIWLNYNK